MEVRPPEVSFDIEAGQFQNEGATGSANAIDATISVTFNPATAAIPATVYLQIPSNSGFGTDWDFERDDRDNYVGINSCDTSDPNNLFCIVVFESGDSETVVLRVSAPLDNQVDGVFSTPNRDKPLAINIVQAADVGVTGVPAFDIPTDGNQTWNLTLRHIPFDMAFQTASAPQSEQFQPIARDFTTDAGDSLTEELLTIQAANVPPTAPQATLTVQYEVSLANNADRTAFQIIRYDGTAETSCTAATCTAVTRPDASGNHRAILTIRNLTYEGAVTVSVVDGLESTYVAATTRFAGTPFPRPDAIISFTAPPGIQAAEQAVSQIRGYHATVTYDLGRQIVAGDSGDLTVNITQGDLGVDAFAVNGAGDFDCNDGNDRCEYSFDANDDDVADDVGRDSLDLVLSLAILGVDNIGVTLTSDDESFPIADDASAVITRTDYIVRGTIPQVLPELVEGGSANSFAVAVTPRLAVPLTVQQQLNNASNNGQFNLDDIEVFDADGIEVTCRVGRFDEEVVCDLVMAAESGVSGEVSPSGESRRQFSILAVPDAVVEVNSFISSRILSSLLIPAGSGWVGDGTNFAAAFLLRDVAAPATTQPVSGQISQVRGYHATVTYRLPRNIIAATDTTGVLTVTVTDGTLGTDAFVVAAGTDFTCDSGDNHCTYTLPGTVLDRNSLNLVLSLAIGGADSLAVTLTANSGNPLLLVDDTDTAVTITKQDYIVDTPLDEQVADISEGGPPDDFDVRIAPRPAVGLTVPWRLIINSGSDAAAVEAGDVIFRNSAGVAQTCTRIVIGISTNVLRCDLIVAAQVGGGIRPSGEPTFGFSIEAVSDEDAEGDANVSLAGLLAVDSDGLTAGDAVNDPFFINNVNPPDADFDEPSSDVARRGGQVLIPLSLTPNGNAAGGVPITVQWTFDDAQNRFVVVCEADGVSAVGTTVDPCESVVADGESSADIAVNSAATATAGTLTITIIDGDGYDPGNTQTTHEVNIVQLPAADFDEASSEVQAVVGQVAITLSLSSPVAVGAEPVTISWSFADTDAAFGTTAECFDSTDGTQINDPDVIADAATADCRSVIPADGSDTAEIIITANDDSTENDANLELAIIDRGVVYDIGTRNPTHEVALTAPPPDADFVGASSDVQAESGEVVIALSLSSPVAVGAQPVTILWTFADTDAAFGTDSVCFDSGGDQITDTAAANSGNCRSAVLANSDTAQIIITANEDSTVGAANLTLSITADEGVDYLVGDTDEHQVALTPPPVVDFASAGPSYVPHGGNEVRIQVDLSPSVPAGDTLNVDWFFDDSSFDAGAPVCPNAAVDGTTTTCTTTVQGNADPANANSFEIVFNSDAASTADDIGESLAINLDDAVGYTLGTPTLHIVEISQPDSAAVFVEASSQVREDGGRVLILVSLAEPVHPQAQPVTISWSYDDDVEGAFDPVCFIGVNNQGIDSASGNCESVVAPGQQQTTITVDSADDSNAGDDPVVNLQIRDGNGYVPGVAVSVRHQVALFAAPAASFDAATSELEHGDFTTGGRVEVQLNLAGTNLPDYRVQWRFESSGSGHPFEFQCPRVGGEVENITFSDRGGAPNPDDPDDLGGDCESVVAAGENSVNIVINSAANSAARNIGDALTLSIIASDEYTHSTDVHQVNIIAAAAAPQVGFTAGAAEVYWGRDLEISVTVNPPLSADADGNLPFNFSALGFADDWVSEGDTDIGGVLNCASSSCVLTDPDETQSPIVATVQFTQEAALTPLRVVTVSLANDVYLTAINNAAGDDTYTFGNRRLVVNVINPIITRTTAEEIEIREGESANVVFTRDPIIGDGNGFAVGVGFPNVNGASAADIAAINVNEADADCILTPPISCPGNFGGGVGDLTVSIAITVDFELNESQELIVLSLQAQNGHDVNPAAFVATVTIVNVNSQVSFTNAPADIFWGEEIAPLVAVNPASPRAVGVSVLATALAAGGAIADLLPNVNPDPAVGTAQCATVDGQRRCQIAALAQNDTIPSTANSLQTGPFGGYALTLILDDASVSDVGGQIYAPTPISATLTISVSRYAVTLAAANAPSNANGFRSGEEGVIQILDDNAQAGGVPSWADGDFSVAISINGGVEGTNWEVRTLPDAAGVAQGDVIDECDIGCGIAWTNTDDGANAYLRILEETATVVSVFLLNVPSAATTPATTPGAITVVDFVLDAVEEGTPIADFAAPSSDVRAEGGRIIIPVNINPAPAGDIDVVWTYDAGEDPHPFIPACFDASGDRVPLAQSATTCQTNVPAGQSSFNITVSSTDDSVADVGTLNLSITVGTGYAVGTTQPNHVVNVITPPFVSYSRLSTPPLDTVTGIYTLRSNGGQLRLGLRLTETDPLTVPPDSEAPVFVPADELLTVRWSYLERSSPALPLAEAGFVIPTDTRCFTIGGETPILDTSTTSEGFCVSVVPGGESSVEITLNSAVGSSAGVPDLRLRLEDGVGYEPPGRNNIAFVRFQDIDIAAASASPSQVKGYLATIAFALGAPAVAETTGTLSVTFADGILGDEVVGVSGAGDFICTETDGQPTDSCVHIFESGDATAESLSLVLSLAIGGDLDRVPMAFSGEASRYVVTESDIILTRTNYTVTFAAADQIADITEGAATADAFDLSVTPALANDITIALRLTAAATPANALDPIDVTLLRLPNTPITCTPDTSDATRQILDCDLIALGDSGIVAADPTGTSSRHGFSIGAVDDSDPDGIGVQARPIAGVGYDILDPDPVPSTNTDDFRIIDSAAAGLPAVSYAIDPPLSQQSGLRQYLLPSNGGQLRVGLNLSPAVPAGETITVRWELAHFSIPLVGDGYLFQADRCFTISGGVETPTTPSDGAFINGAGICESDVTGPATSFEITVNSPVGFDAGSGSQAHVALSLIADDDYNLNSAAVNARGILLTDRAIRAAARSISQFNGYYAAIAFNLEEPISARTTGDLTVSFDSGVLGNAVSGVASAGEVVGDFTCDADNNRCEYSFDSNAAADATAESLSLVLSVSLSDPPPLQVRPSQVTMTLSGSALGYNVLGGRDLAITLSRANYTVDLADGAIPDLIEGSAPSAFNVDITPRPVIGLTVSLRFRNTSAPEIIETGADDNDDPGDIAISRLIPANSDDFPAAVTCVDILEGADPALLCTLIMPPDSSATIAAVRAATPSGTYEPQFSIAALQDNSEEPVFGIQAIFRPGTPTPGPGGYVAGSDFDEFFIRPDGGPDVGFVEANGVSQVPVGGGGVEIPLALSEPGGAIIDIRWSYTIDGVAPDDPDTAEDDAEPIPFVFDCPDASGVPRPIVLGGGVCETRLQSQQDAFVIAVNTPDDSDLSDYAGSPRLDLQIEVSLAYDIVEANDDHRVNLVAAAPAAGAVSFNTGQETAAGEAFFTGYWGAFGSDRSQSFRLPLLISPPYSPGTDPILDVTSRGENFDIPLLQCRTDWAA